MQFFFCVHRGFPFVAKGSTCHPNLSPRTSQLGVVRIWLRKRTLAGASQSETQNVARDPRDPCMEGVHQLPHSVVAVEALGTLGTLPQLESDALPVRVASRVSRRLVSKDAEFCTSAARRT